MSYCRLLACFEYAIEGATELCSQHAKASSRPSHLTNRDLVIEANEQDDSLDARGIVWFEHINLVLGDRELGEMFYFDLLGCTRDTNADFHANLGQQQFHLNVGGGDNGEPQVVRGSIGLALPSLATFRERLAVYGPSLQNACALLNSSSTAFSSLFKVEDYTDSIVVTCPWGNTFALFAADDVASESQTAVNNNVMSQKHANFDRKMAVRGKPGIRYIEFRVRNIIAVASFYSQVLGCTIHYSSDRARVAVMVGPSCHFVFSQDEETNQAKMDEEVRKQQGIHVCVYIEQFKHTFLQLQSMGLTWTNPRFSWLDTCDTWQQANSSRQFRFQDFPHGGFTLEHETRAVRHHQFLKVPNYQPM